MELYTRGSFQTYQEYHEKRLRDFTTILRIFTVVIATIMFFTSFLNEADASEFETLYKVRRINNGLGTMCDGYLNGSYLVALKENKLFAIKVVEHVDWASYIESYSLDDVGFVHFKKGEVYFVSITTGEKIRVKLSELEGVLR